MWRSVDLALSMTAATFVGETLRVREGCDARSEGLGGDLARGWCPRTSVRISMRSDFGLFATLARGSAAGPGGALLLRGTALLGRDTGRDVGLAFTRSFFFFFAANFLSTVSGWSTSTSVHL